MKSELINEYAEQGKKIELDIESEYIVYNMKDGKSKVKFFKNRMKVPIKNGDNALATISLKDLIKKTIDKDLV